MSLLNARALDVRLGGRSVLNGASLTVAPGEIIGLIGPNGAGKSTLLKALCGLVPIAGGTVEIADKPVSAYSPKARARALAYLPQQGASHWPVTVETLVSMGRLPHLGPLRGPGPTDRAAVERALAATDLLALRDRPMDRLSGGEAARALLARALAVESRLLLADEPVAGLDPAHQLDVMHLLGDGATDGRGVVVVLHDLGLAARFCARLILLHQGAVLADGPPKTVLTPANLAAAFGIRAHIGEADGANYVVPLARTRGAGRTDDD